MKTKGKENTLEAIYVKFDLNKRKKKERKNKLPDLSAYFCASNATLFLA